MAFEEISQVVPWLESAVDMGIDPWAEQAFEPRLFKAHLEWHRIPKGGRYITAFRAPDAVLVSFYQFFENWFFEAGSISIDTFAEEWFLEGTASGGYWDHLLSWAPRIAQKDVGESGVLALTYEDMVQVPDAVPRVVAGFLGLQISEAAMAKVVAQSSRAFMAAHADQFDEHLLRDRRDAFWGLPPGAISTKVQAASGAGADGGAAGAGDGAHIPAAKPVLSTATRALLDAAWQRQITPKLGFKDYAAFRASLPNPLGADRAGTV